MHERSRTKTTKETKNTKKTKPRTLTSQSSLFRVFHGRVFSCVSCGETPSPPSLSCRPRESPRGARTRPRAPLRTREETIPSSQRSRWDRGGGHSGLRGEKRSHGLRCRASIRDAIRNPHAAETAAGREEPRMVRERAIDRGHPLEVTDLVLRVAALPAIHAREQRRASDAEERPQCRQRHRHEIAVGTIERLRVAR